MSNRNNSGIVVHFEHETLHLVLFHQFCFAFFSIRIHGAEFIKVENAPISSHSFLFKDYMSGALNENDRRKNKKNDCSKYQSDKAYKNVHCSFDETLAYGHWIDTCCNHCTIVDDFNCRVWHVFQELPHIEMNDYSHINQFFNYVISYVAFRDADKGFVNDMFFYIEFVLGRGYSSCHLIAAVSTWSEDFV